MHNHNDIFATALDLREHDRLAHHDLRLPHDYCFDIATDHMGLSEESGFMGFRDEIFARRTDLLLMICDCFCISTGLS